MRRSVVRTVEGAATCVRQTTRSTPSKAPFVCASCRRATVQGQRRVAFQPQRSFLTNASRRQQTAPIEAQEPQRTTFVPQSHYDFFPETFPHGPPPNSPFTPDLRQLRKEYLQLQARSHPDLAPQSQKRQAEATSMRVSEAYRALQDPLKRAQYLLSLRGIDVEDESAKLSESELLMEVMEAREEVEEVETEEQLSGIRTVNNERIAQAVAALEKAFANGDVELAAKEAIRLRYWMNIEESIHGWEKGKGGGVLHH